jgi:hypothetical protein
MMIVKRPMTREGARLWCLWLMYGRCPSEAKPDVDGHFDLGEVGETRGDRGVERWCPYAPAEGIKA